MVTPTWLRRFGLRAAFAGVLLSWCPGALALNPELDVSQYAHTAWRIREGFTKDYAASLTQTPDGYLWLGTLFGPVRFDGARAMPWSAGSHGQQEALVPRLFTARDGTLWIAGYPGLASWKDGKRTDHPELASLLVTTLFEDRAGTLWAGAGPLGGPARLCAREQGRFQCRGEDGSLGRWVSALLEDGKGQLWVLTTAGLWRWHPGSPVLVPLPEPPMDGSRSLAEGDDGELLVATRAGIRRVSDGKVGELLIRSDESTGVMRNMLRDRHGALWIGTSNRGLLHVRRGRVDVFAEANGLSGNSILDLFEDREGTVWISTNEGLDRFREFAAATTTAGQGLPPGGIMSVVAARDGSVWVSTSSALGRRHAGQWTVLRTPHDKRLPGMPAGSGSLFQDSRSRVWFGGYAAFGYFENDRFIAVGGVPGGYVDEIGEDRAGNLWIAHRNAGLLRISPDLEVRRTAWSALGSGRFAWRIAVDPMRGGLWLGYLENGVAHVVDGKVRASYTVADGLGRGIVNQVRVGTDGAVWVATEGGLSRLKNGRSATLSSRNGMPCDVVNWMIDGDDDVWLYLGCGVARIARAELNAWAAAADEGKAADRAIRATVFDNSDGIRNVRIPASYTPAAARGTDGKLWFVAPDGVSVLDPRNLPRNALPPPVQIESVVADRKPYDLPSAGTSTLALPPLVRDLQVDYTATSLVAPEKMRFRYKLEGQDRDWQDAGTRRQAFYNGLHPGTYRFRVSASNNSGVWNEAGASIAFSIAPAYYQTAWFRLLVAAALAGALWAAYRWRVRVLAARLNEVQGENRERRRAAEALRESDARFRALTELSSDWYWQQDANLRFVYLSSGYDNLAGYPAETAIGKLRWELHDVMALTCTWQEHEATLAARQPFRDFEYSRIDQDGAIRYLSVSGAPVFDEEGRFKGYQGIGRNITARKRIEEQLRSRQDMLDLAQRSARAAAFEWRRSPPAKGSPWASSWNMPVSAEFEEMFGVKPGGFDGSFESWKKLVFPEDWAGVKQGIASAYKTGEMFLEYRVRGASGELRWLESKGRVLYDADGQPDQIVGFALDVTAKHQAEEELRRLEGQLRQSQRLEAMGTLAGGIAHDFNNILGAILGYGEMALRGARQGSRLKRDLDSIMAAGERGRALVDRVLAFSRSGVGERVPVHVEKVVREALDLIEARLPAEVNVKTNLAAGRAATVGESTQVHQVMMNLGTNGIQAMTGGGILSVSLELVDCKAARRATVGNLVAGEYIRLTVTDNGSGIPQEIMDKIFDPFFTTKETGVGTGLGLSLVHGIVMDLGGAVDVESSPGAGSTFIVFMPRTGDMPGEEERDDAVLPHGAGERVLVVDDEEPLVRLTTETLDELGYASVGFTSSTAALDAFRADPEGFDAVITDERMPGMSGATLIREVRRVRETIPILLVSGYIGGTVMDRAFDEGASEVLKKPLSAQELAVSLARVLRA